jgi:hypothetical protein
VEWGLVGAASQVAANKAQIELQLFLTTEELAIEAEESGEIDARD